MTQLEPTTWIEHRIAELEADIAAWKAEMKRRLAAGTGPEPDPQALAKVEEWEKEFKGLKSLRDVTRDAEGA
jgi:hypothetical protein